MSLTEAEVRTFVDRHIGPMARVMGVAHWEIGVSYGPACRPEFKADVVRELDYQQLTITIDPEHCDDEQSVVRTLIHELSHVLLAPFQLYRDMMTQHVRPGTVEHRREARLWHHVEETIVVNIERMHAMLTFENPYRDDGDRGYAMPARKPGKPHKAPASPKAKRKRTAK